MRSSKSRSRHAVDIQERGAREVVNLPLVLGAEKAFYGTFPLRNPGGGEPDLDARASGGPKTRHHLVTTHR